MCICFYASARRLPSEALAPQRIAFDYVRVHVRSSHAFRAHHFPLELNVGRTGACKWHACLSAGQRLVSRVHRRSDFFDAKPRCLELQPVAAPARLHVAHGILLSVVRGCRAGRKDYKTLERSFWKSVTMNPPLYGADTPMSLFDQNAKGWGLGNLADLLKEKGVPEIPGVTTPMAYFGMWKARPPAPTHRTTPHRRTLCSG